MPRPPLAVVVLTWNGRDDTLACLDSLAPSLREGDRVILVDNGSHDGTEEAVRARHPRAERIQNGRNLGYAAGNNVGLRAALAHGTPWVLLLNNDTVVPPGALDALVAHGASRPRVAAVQALLVRADDPQVIDSCGHRLTRRPGAVDWLMGRPVAEAPREPVAVFGACGAAALLRASALREVGLLDERLFVLGEDLDLMFRLRIAGHEVELVPSARVLHRRGISARPASDPAARRRAWWLRRNLVALGVRYWPARLLVAAAPWIAEAKVRALLGPRPAEGGGSAVRLWWQASRERPAARRGMRRQGLDAWIGGPPCRAASQPASSR